jgi:hypothetical protein
MLGIGQQANRPMANGFDIVTECYAPSLSKRGDECLC